MKSPHSFIRGALMPFAAGLFLAGAPLFAQVPGALGRKIAHRHLLVPNKVIFVDASATGADDGTSWADAFSDLQDALAVARVGNQVWVAAGVYTPSATDATKSFPLGRGVALFGGFNGTETKRQQRDWNANPTILSGDIGRDDGPGWTVNSANSGHVVDASGADTTSILDGFTISDGNTGPAGTPAGDPLMFGSGIFILGGSPVVRNCLISHNLAAFASGGGVYAIDGSPSFLNCQFVGNYVHGGNGGGLFLYGSGSPTVRDCVFSANQCVAIAPAGASGGGLDHRGPEPLTVLRCQFLGNICRPFYSIGSDLGYGGGVSNFVGAGPITLRDCVFMGNQAQYGGGFMTWMDATVVDCLFTNNRANPHPNDPYPEQGGVGAGLMSNASLPSVMTVINTTIAFNNGKKNVGLFGGGTGGARIDNSILWGNRGTSPEVIGFWPEQIGGNWSASYSCMALIFDPPAPGEDVLDPAKIPGCIDLDPLFVNPAPAGDLHLSPGSPCIDAGDNARIPASIVLDLDGNPRFLDDPGTPDTGSGAPPLADMGAYEKQP